MKKNTFEYFIPHKYGQDSVSEAKKHIPEWYKKSQQFLLKTPADAPVTKGLKLCSPFLDGLTVGYMLELTQDIRVALNNEGNPCLTWTDSESGGVSVQIRNLKSEVPVPTGFKDVHFVWNSTFSFRLPKGYSAICTHPLNRSDLPFQTLSGIIDLDKGIQGGSIPFFIKDGFEGIIEAGTPFLQIIPFKRETWIKKFNPELEEVSRRLAHLSSRAFYGFYKKNLWHKKEFN